MTARIEPIARNCANWKDGVCESCGVQWQHHEVGPDFKCPHFTPRLPQRRIMKAFSLYQPWAWLMVNGFKDVENRDWKPTNPGLRFRGQCLVHASRTFEEECYPFVAERFPAIRGLMPTRDKLPAGGIVGVFEVFDCVTESNNPWFFGTYGFLVRNAAPLPFKPLRGMLGFFDVDVGALGLEVPA